MRKVINYTTFTSNEEFTKWQLEGDVKKVHTVQPQLIEMGIGLDEFDDGKTKGATGAGKTTFGVFVTYLTEIEDGTED